MSKTESIAQLPLPSAEVQANLHELAVEAWQDRGELSNADKQALEAALASYEPSNDAGSSWDHVKARIQARLRP